MKTLLFLAISSLALVLVSAVVEKWPKLDCHPGYDAAKGEKTSKDNGMACNKEVSKDPKTCKKECLYRWVGIMVRGRNQMGTAKSIENTLLRSYFTDSDEGKASAHELSTKIIAECKAKLDSLKDQSCKEWTPFYECVDAIMTAC